MLTISEMVEAISKRAEGRFDVSYADSVELPPPLAEIATAGMQLKRVNQEYAGKRPVKSSTRSSYKHDDWHLLTIGVH